MHHIKNVLVATVIKQFSGIQAVFLDMLGKLGRVIKGFLGQLKFIRLKNCALYVNTDMLLVLFLSILSLIPVQLFCIDHEGSMKK